jgi:hypothetical protein
MGKRKKIEYLTLTWDDIYQLSLKLYEKVKKSGFEPDVIVGIARGGWMPARILSDLMDNPNLANVKAEFYLDVYKTMKKPMITQSVSTSVEGKTVLVVDDVADTGESLKLVKEHLITKGASNVKIGCLHYKPWSILKPDYYVRETRAWVIYPWEYKESVVKIGKKLLEEGKRLKNVEDELVKIGLNRRLVRIFLKEAFS